MITLRLSSEEDTDGEVKEEIEEIQQMFATTKVDDPAFISGLNPKMKKAEHPQLYADKVNRTQEVLVRKTFSEWYDLDFNSAWVSQAQRGTFNQSKFQWYPDSAKQAKELKGFTPYPTMVKDEEVSPLAEYANIAKKNPARTSLRNEVRVVHIDGISVIGAERREHGKILLDFAKQPNARTAIIGCMGKMEGRMIWQRHLC